MRIRKGMQEFPWKVIEANKKTEARIDVMRHILIKYLMTKVSKFSVGSRVAVIDDDIRGKVTRIKGEQVYLVTKLDLNTGKEKELVALGEDQHQLSKYQDIDNPMLNEKVYQIDKKKKSIKRNPKEDIVFEVDLHINKLVKHAHKLDPYDIMIIQMDTAQRKLEYAIQNRIPKIVLSTV